MRVVEPVRKHVAQFARAGHVAELPPADAAVAPVLQTAGADVIRLTDIAVLDEVFHVAHRRHKAIGERGHVADVVLAGATEHVERLLPVHAKRFFAEDVLAVFGGGNRHRRVGEVRRGDDDGVNVVALNEFVVILRVHRCTGLLDGALKHLGAIVAQPHQPCVRTEFQSRKMILQRNAAAADDSYSNGCHVKQALGQAAALATEITPAWSSGRCFWTTSRRPQ